MSKAASYEKSMNIQLINLDEFPKSVWLWKSVSMLDVGQNEKYLSYCNEEKITTLYLYVDDVIGHIVSNQLTPERKKAMLMLESFITLAHQKNVKVHALGGAPDWSLTSQQNIALMFMDSVFKYDKSVPEVARFDGIQYDIEPYGQSGFGKRKAAGLREYLNLIEKLVERHKFNSDGLTREFQFGLAVPYWFDGENKDTKILWHGSQERGVSFFLMDLLNGLPSSYIALMDYRNYAEGSDGSIEHARQEIDYSSLHTQNVKIVLGQETSNVQPSKITFYGLGRTNLQTEMKKIAASFMSKPTFSGFAIHSLDSYMTLK